MITSEPIYQQVEDMRTSIPVYNKPLAKKVISYQQIRDIMMLLYNKISLGVTFYFDDEFISTL